MLTTQQSQRPESLVTAISDNLYNFTVTAHQLRRLSGDTEEVRDLTLTSLKVTILTWPQLALIPHYLILFLYSTAEIE